MIFRVVSLLFVSLTLFVRAGEPLWFPNATNAFRLLIVGTNFSVVSGDQVLLSGTSSAATVVTNIIGPDWQFLSLKLADQRERGILYIAPDLLAILDRSSGLTLDSTAHAQVDPVWGDLIVSNANSVLRVNSPAPKKHLRRWEETTPGHYSVAANPAATPFILTIFAHSSEASPTAFAFKLLESNTAIGARVHRNGLPALLAFKIDATVESASLTGFPFRGPVGVDVFKPRVKAAH